MDKQYWSYERNFLAPCGFFMNSEFQIIRIYAGHLFNLWIQDICLFVFHLFFFFFFFYLSLVFQCKMSKQICKDSMLQVFSHCKLKTHPERLGLFLTPIGHRSFWWSHMWGVPLDLAQSFGTICTHQHCCLLHHCHYMTILRCVWCNFSCERDNTYLTKLLGWLSWKKKKKKRERKKKQTNKQCAHLFTSIGLYDSMFVPCLRPILSSRLLSFSTSMSMSRGGFGD